MSSQSFILAFAGDQNRLDSIAARIAQRTNWRRIDRSEHAAIFLRDDTRCVHDPVCDGTFLIGIAFERGGKAASTSHLTTPSSAEFDKEAFASIFARYWGAYVAIDEAGNEFQAAREPSGALPFYYAISSGVFVAASSARALTDAGAPPPQIDWHGVANCLYRAGLPSEQTALAGIRELLPGDRLRVRDNQITVDHIWSPWNCVAISDRSGEAEHADILRNVVDTTIASWVRQFPNVLVGVSGGLDSSIVTACARKASRGVRAVTVSTANAQGDERVYARELCGALEVPLIEEQYDLADIDLSRAAGAHLPRPVGRSIALAYNAAIARALQRSEAGAFFSGNGGDNVFAFSRSASAIADRFLHEGLTSGAWRTARDICDLTGCSIFRAIRVARQILRRSRRYDWRPDRRLLSPQLLAELDRSQLEHSWLDAPSDSLPGKAAHIAGLLRIQQHIDGTGPISGAPVIHPLLSQPVIEVCLGIPSWMWCRGGRDRAVARRAFADVLPPLIRHRTSKGGPDGFSAQFLTRFRKKAAERILDGHLVRQGIADRSRLETILTVDQLDFGAERVRILEFLNAEAWIGHWRSLHFGPV